MLRIIDVEAPGPLNGHAEENDRAGGAIHRVIQGLLALALTRRCGREPDVHALQFVSEVVLQEVQRASRVKFEARDATVGVGQLRPGRR